jgi:hypothetical protein
MEKKKAEQVLLGNQAVSLLKLLQGRRIKEKEGGGEFN